MSLQMWSLSLVLLDLDNIDTVEVDGPTFLIKHIFLKIYSYKHIICQITSVYGILI